MKETYEFIQLRCHKKIKPLTVWLLKVNAEDVELFEQMHRSISTSNFLRYGKDPHLVNETGDAVAGLVGRILHPINLSSLWTNTAEMLFQQDGYILINKVGGMFPPKKPLKPLATVYQEKCIWPDEYNKKYKNERIKILRWNM